MSTEVVERSTVRCSKCRRLLGSARTRQAGITCSRPGCTFLDLPMPATSEDRDAVIEILLRTQSMEDVANVVGLTRQRVGQISLARRRVSA